MDEKSNKKGKKPRGQNYTEEDRQIFLEVIKKYQHIVSDKRTNSLYIKQKAIVWQKIAREYNSHALSGQRTVDQLKRLYDNLKHRCRKESAEENKLKYKRREEEVEVTEEELKIIRKIASSDKKEMNKTGGGSYSPQLKDDQLNILGIIADQVKPDQNSFDDAAIYFGNISQCSPIEESPFIDEAIVVEQSSQESGSNIEVIEQTNRNEKENRNKSQLIKNTNNSVQDEKKKAESFKIKYFRGKFKNVLLERKFLLKNHKAQQAKDRLELQILRERLNKIRRH